MRLWLKILMVVGMTLAILVPLALIRGTIHERQAYRNEAVRDVAANFGGPQVFGGPVLVVPYTETVDEDVVQPDGEVRRTVQRRTGSWTFFPETLSIEGSLQPDTRRRGLHEVRVYQWDGVAKASFDVRLPPLEDAAAQREVGRPWLSYGIVDVRGLRGTPRLQVDGAAVTPLQGIGHVDGPGLHVRLDAPDTDRIELETGIELQLRGTEAFAMMPYGRSNDLQLASPWRHPKFEGVSPQHDIDAQGFRARWQIASVASNAQRRYLQSPALAGEQAAGVPWTAQPDGVSVALVDPVNPYLQADRATKYGLLFVMLTFVGFFMFELLKRLPIHPIQYALVGLAIAIFFLLLVSLSEHVAFGLAYLAAAVACIGLIGFYLSAVLRSTARGLGFAVMLAALYAALYGLLVSDDNALVLGAGLLFLILAAIMVATRKVDWYQVASRPGVAQG
ncbi:cell envelope integrity protein CreD [Luteimonas composti]|uniref:Cell envelope integrity protein CreD n=1 Tax=Luteimonas composti TaxID=398257 RepID=A0ABT6MVL6_9GAMM|nr:cell envelope integrity protein CreD [Luteimonas composti]MDH7454666.1 cell envelope integrity protein CreD [Luteimonas composti]